ncbi:MAG: aminoglycoside phosphotransferase family protein [Methylomonas sp.]
MNPQLVAIAGQFSAGQTVTGVKPLGLGLINDSYRVDTVGGSFVLQRINNQVFPQPANIMANLRQLSRHIALLPAAAVKLKIPAIILTGERKTCFPDTEQHYWRALELIAPAESREFISRPEEAAQVGFALAHFHNLCSRLPTATLHDTLPGFHITPAYYRQYANLKEQRLPHINSAESRFCRKFIDSFHARIDVLENAKLQGRLMERVIHGDPKLNNFLFTPGGNEIVSLIDLDTVKPGLIHYDLGDCLRSSCHNADNNRFDSDRAEIILGHYLAEAGQFLTEADYDYLYAAIELLPFELGLRFYSDYLAGNRYFKVSDSEQNLRRARDLFELCNDINRQRPQIEKMLAGIKSKL